MKTVREEILEVFSRHKMIADEMGVAVCGMTIGTMMALDFSKQEALETFGRMWDENNNLTKANKP